MGTIETDRQQKRTVLGAIMIPDDVDSPRRVFMILKQFLVVALPAEVPQPACPALRRRDQPGFTFQPLARSRTDDIEVAIAFRSHPSRYESSDAIIYSRHRQNEKSPWQLLTSRQPVFRDLIEAAHAKGIGVILDWVPGPTNSYL